MISARVMISALLVLVSNAAGQSLAAVARVSSVTGSAVLSGADGISSFSLTRGYLLNPGDRVDTRGGGRVVVDLSDGSMVVVQPGTLLSIKDFRGAANARELFEILLGAVRVKIQHLTGKPNPYRMNTPTASIAVRGTEFDVVIGEGAETRVSVFEGAVEVGSLSDPDNKALIEAGGAVLVRPGQPIQFLSAVAARATPRVRPRAAPPPRPASQEMAAARAPDAGRQPGGRHDTVMRGLAPVATPPVREASLSQRSPGAYERYISDLTTADSLPLLGRFAAFSEPHIDSFENPAYASSIRTGEGRAFLMPVRAGSEYALMPQASFFQPAGKSVVIGGGIARAHMGGALDSVATAFSSITALTAMRLGSSAAGFSVEQSGASGVSQVRQLRLTAGLRRDFGDGHQAGVFGRYGTLDTSSFWQPGNAIPDRAPESSGHTTEVGIRLRGPLAGNIWYGASASFARVSMSASARTGVLNGDAARNWVTFGLGYAPDRRTVLSFDVTGGVAWRSDERAEKGTTLQSASLRTRFSSLHAGVQRDLSSRLYAYGSAVSVWRSDMTDLALYPDRVGRTTFIQEMLFPVAGTPALGSRYVEIGAGWRISPVLAVQYLFGLSNSAAPSSHTVALRYSFRLTGRASAP